MNTLKVAPSLLAADFSKLAVEVEKVEKAGAEWLHLDVMDGAFVPNISFGPCVISCLRGISKMFFDVHLMINEPIRYLEDYKNAGADGITVHAEACSDLEGTLKAIRAMGLKAGVSVKPKTPVSFIEKYLPLCDNVLIMTVEPGFGGQSLIPETLEKVSVLRKYVSERGINLDIEVDGGINADNVGLLTSAGANVIVAGSAIFKAKKPKQVIQDMKDAAVKNPFIG